MDFMHFKTILRLILLAEQDFIQIIKLNKKNNIHFNL